MLLIGLSELALSHQCLTGLYFRCPSSKMLLHHLELAQCQFLLHFHARPRPWGASLKLEVGRRWSGGLWKFNEIKSKTVGASAERAQDLVSVL